MPFRCVQPQFICYFQDNPNKIDKLAFLDSSRLEDFDRISSEIGRSKDCCKHHWQIYIVPVLKTDTLCLPQNMEWKKDVLRYIIEKKFISFKDIQYNKVVTDVCPGQTPQSLSMFVRNVSQHAKDTPLHECCNTYLNNPNAHSYLVNDERAQTKFEYASKILEIKQKLKSN